MNDICEPTKFDCLILDADLVAGQPYDDVIFLLSLYDHLEQQCDDETDQLEALADNISRRAEAAKHSRVGGTFSNATWPEIGRSLDVQKRAEIAERYQVPYHVFGTARASRGGKDLEFSQLEAMDLKIRNYLAQMEELEVEIAAAMPKTPEGVMLKLNFLSGLSKEGSGFAADVLSFVVEQSVQQLSNMLDVPLAGAKT